MAERYRTDSTHADPQLALARQRRPRPHAGWALAVWGLGLVCVAGSVVIGYAFGVPYIKAQRLASDPAAPPGLSAQAETARNAETSAAPAPAAGGERTASSQAFERALHRDRRWAASVIALAATLGVVSLVLGVRLRQAKSRLRRIEEDAAVEMQIGDCPSAPWAAPPLSPVELLRAARADLHEARREARDAISVDPTLLGRDDVLPLQAGLLEDDLIELRRSRIALENRFSANLALEFDASLQDRIAGGSDFLESPSTTGHESHHVQSVS